MESELKSVGSAAREKSTLIESSGCETCEPCASNHRAEVAQFAVKFIELRAAIAVVAFNAIPTKIYSVRGSKTR